MDCLSPVDAECSQVDLYPVEHLSLEWIVEMRAGSMKGLSLDEGVIASSCRGL